MTLQSVSTFDPLKDMSIDLGTYYYSGGIVNGTRHTQTSGVGGAPDDLANPWGAGIGCTVRMRAKEIELARGKSKRARDGPHKKSRITARARFGLLLFDSMFCTLLQMTRPYTARADGAIGPPVEPLNEYFCPVATA